MFKLAKGLLLVLILGLTVPYVASAVAQSPKLSELEHFSLGYRAEGVMLSQRNGLAVPSMLLKINPEPGVITLIGDTGFSNCTALDFNNNGTLYAKCQRPEPPYTPVLIMLNPQTGEGTEIGETGITEYISDIAVGSDNSIFSYEEPPKESHNLHQVNGDTGAAQLLGNPGIEGLGNAIFLSPSGSELKLLTSIDGQNMLYRLDKQTAEATFKTNLTMVDEFGQVLSSQDCAALATDSLQGVTDLIAANTQSTDSRELKIAGFDAVGMFDLSDSNGPSAEGAAERIELLPFVAMGLIDADEGIVKLTEPFYSEYVLDGLAVRKVPPRAIPTMSEWGLIAISALLMLAALYFILKKDSLLIKLKN